MLVGSILQTAAVDYAMMLVARVVTGVGNGLLTSTVPAYQSECSKPHRRGQLVLVEGSLIAFWHHDFLLVSCDDGLRKKA